MRRKSQAEAPHCGGIIPRHWLEVFPNSVGWADTQPSQMALRSSEIYIFGTTLGSIILRLCPMRGIAGQGQPTANVEQIS